MVWLQHIFQNEWEKRTGKEKRLYQIVSVWRILFFRAEAELWLNTECTMRSGYVFVATSNGCYVCFDSSLRRARALDWIKINIVCGVSLLPFAAANNYGASGKNEEKFCDCNKVEILSLLLKNRQAANAFRILLSFKRNKNDKQKKMKKNSNFRIHTVKFCALWIFDMIQPSSVHVNTLSERRP